MYCKVLVNHFIIIILRLGKAVDVAFLKVLLINIIFKNNRSTPVSIKTKSLKEIVVLNKTQGRYETIIVGTVIIPELVFQIYDLHSGKLLVTDQKGGVSFKTTKIKEYLYTITGSLVLNERKGKLKHFKIYCNVICFT